VTYRWLEHTAELGLEIEAASPAGVFTEAAAALGELVRDDERAGPREARTITLAGITYADLLAAWLEELVFFVETEAFIPESAEIAVEPPDVDGTVTGRRGAPRHLVKGVTYHELSFAREGDVWRAHVVLDV
jgi:SHS2 domain-containing protein